MNQLGRDVLIAAMQRGQRQMFGEYGEYQSGDALCAGGVLGLRWGLSSSAREAIIEKYALVENWDEECPACGLPANQRFGRGYRVGLLAHLNDNHRFDFFTIAKMLVPRPGDSDATMAESSSSTSGRFEYIKLSTSEWLQQVKRLCRQMLYLSVR